ncbi:rRNA adenine N-6-methyltransferase family protein [Aureibaculum sp. 2210JD6-5]|uniref:THUMP-like domain-containing protein n=1 Tax=Aureibaculum sp. 2210JD6-5 TaxID=3103957 RepID=UPI002AACCF78|nr:rRNA adenine N-6-methyltransferase family protein [Aureibaculum sp. 2210JD6-5]MDY7396613.1 rRNA adenine N-6-methyltransferase family protein [Aureibaculum sp. 2210JD6-5]
MNKHILNTEPQDFINQNLNADIAKLIFKGSPFKNITVQELVEQIEAKKKAMHKLPTWFATENIYYPNKLNIEQTSSETTANYKANLISGETIIDLTGGFGVDALAFANAFKQVTHCEIDSKLSSIAKHNFKALNIQNINTINDDGVGFLKRKKQQFDCINIDPSRRNDVKGKVFLLEDCEPNVPENLSTLFNFSDNIMVKVSPMLDITSAISELNFVKEIHVVAIQNEVKELLFILEKGFKSNIKIKTVNIKKETIESFDSSWLKNNIPAQLSEPLTYLYEPNSAILKAGLFNEVSHQLKVFKLNTNSHLYTSNNLILFPGRRFKIINKVSYNLKEIKKALVSKQANITTRNFPETVAQIRKKTKLKEGGDHYLFFTKDVNDNHIVLICEKV